MKSVSRCEACGMAMHQPSQRGNGDSSHPYCIYCTDMMGQLRPKSEIREGMIQYIMKFENCPRDRAELEADRQLKVLPAWQGAA